MHHSKNLEYYQELAYKQFNGTITQQEADELSEWLNSDDSTPLEIENISDFNMHKKQLWSKINTARQPVKSIKPAIIKFAAAAAIIAVISSAAYYYLAPFKPASETTFKATNDVLPGTEGAILTLADGKRIVLDNLNDGLIARENGSSVSLNKGQLQYTVENSAQKAALNTMYTPRGKTYKLVLPDGTNVWLNASSSITYPTVFNAESREVNVNGEVYFEVQKDTRRPFLVNSKNTTIKVLGTHFNVNAYDDEPSEKTTLIEGSIMIMNGAGKSVIKPGYQAEISKTKKGIDISPADTEAVIAWKDGLFQYNNTELKFVLRDISRWYNVEIVYEGAVSSKSFVGQIPKKAKLSTVLQSLENTGLHFRMDGRRMIVTQ